MRFSKGVWIFLLFLATAPLKASEPLSLIKHSWSDAEFQIIEFDLLASEQLGLRHMRHFAWRPTSPRADRPFFPLYCSGYMGKWYDGYMGGLPGRFFSFEANLCTATHSACDFCSPLDEFKITGVYKSLFLSATRRLKYDSAAVIRATNSGISDGHITVHPFGSKKRILYFAMKTKDERFSLMIDLPFPTRDERQAEVFIKDSKANKIIFLGPDQIERIYVNGDGNIYVKGKTAEGVTIEAYWPSKSHVRDIRHLREALLQPGEFSEQPFIDETDAGKIVVNYVDSLPSESAKQHFLYSLGETPFFKFGDDHFRFSDIEEITDGKEPRVNLDGSRDALKKEATYREMGL